MNLLLAGGSSGGHLVPGVAVARAWEARGGGVLFLTSGRAIEGEVLAGEAFPRACLGIESNGRLRPGLRLLAATWRAMRAVRSFRPAVVLGLGGAASVPGVLAARLSRVPIALLEVNAAPGRATRRLRPLAARILTGDEPSARALGSRARAVGVPTRPSGAAPARGPAREGFGLRPEVPTLLVAGGSQGADAINRFAATHAGLLAAAGVQVIHLAGPGKTEEPERAYRAAGLRARVFGFLRDTAPAYAAADLVLCRGGAATVAEVAEAGRGAVVVPYPHHADRHQFENARRLGSGALVLEEADLGASAMGEVVRRLGDPRALETMGAAAGRAARPSATESVVDDLVLLAGSAPSPTPRGAVEDRS
ncbi:MAG TPA: UDP-N-acetylglucosamine--N-acetylmuramyl-(pentapeptide) pyrophosphoryl-undecaprenol N-acetylglucosamine transferase [Planctomycetota bacterium]|jgi:UDP-N-acetylglucosamine--N-acetylmuramyl-(pentapeptide) pyrophosphoryl-undecaprenol N-acetylglucosamine transferase|nr:UDP-N-acetylglucosamine--N-acetylmuramyl-(pentapeptide) pyrophosphoryl-undecaprenol N-acetylglucosamine transferase [Planctomycetota bacterium]